MKTNSILGLLLACSFMMPAFAAESSYAEAPQPSLQPSYGGQAAGQAIQNKRINRTLAASALASAAIMGTGFVGLAKTNGGNNSVLDLNSFLFSIGFGGLTGTACGALEHNNVHPFLTWLGEWCIRKGCIKGIGMKPREEHLGFSTWGVEYPAHAGSWISYLLYQYAKQTGKSADEAKSALASLSALQLM